MVDNGHLGHTTDSVDTEHSLWCNLFLQPWYCENDKLKQLIWKASYVWASHYTTSNGFYCICKSRLIKVVGIKIKAWHLRSCC